MDFGASSAREMAASTSKCGPNQTHVLLLEKLEESVVRLHRQIDAEFLKFMKEVQHSLEKNSANLAIDLSDALEKLCNTNKSIHPTQTFDINDPNTSNGNRNHFRSLAKFAHSDSHVYCALAAKNPCSIFPAVATWIKHESAYYHSLAILYQAHASWLAFDKNNTMSKVGPNEIDLHDQHLNDANQILANWMKEGKRNGEDHLHVITGSGKHSHDGAVLKPHVINVCSALKLKFEPESNQGRIRIQFSDAASIRKCNNCGPDIVKTPTELERHEAREFGREIRNGERATGNQQENHQATPGSTFGGPHPHQNNQQRGGSSSTRFAQYQAPVGNRTTLPQAPSSNTTGHHQAPINNTTASPQPPPIHTTTPPHSPPRNPPTLREDSAVSIRTLANRVLALYFPGYPTHHSPLSNEDREDARNDIRAICRAAESRVPRLGRLSKVLDSPIDQTPRI